MIGYHFTTHQNWQLIKRQGLQPANLGRAIRDGIKKELGVAPRSLKGIWLWKQLDKHKALIGSVLRTVAYHNSHRVVLLEVNYDSTDRLLIYGRPLLASHSGYIENYVFHRGNKHKSVIVGGPIPPSRITKIAEWDLSRLLTL